MQHPQQPLLPHPAARMLAHLVEDVRCYLPRISLLTNRQCNANMRNIKLYETDLLAANLIHEKIMNLKTSLAINHNSRTGSTSWLVLP